MSLGFQSFQVIARSTLNLILAITLSSYYKIINFVNQVATKWDNLTHPPATPENHNA